MSELEPHNHPDAQQFNAGLQVEVLLLEGGGAGSISRTARLKQYPQLESVVQRADQGLENAEYLEEALLWFITRCGDGRGCEETNGGCQLFGGTPGLIKSKVIAGLIPAGNTAADDIRTEVERRESNNMPSGGHTADTHNDSTKCGCGECDGAQKAAELYINNEEALKPLVTLLWQKTGMSEQFGEFDESMYQESLENLKSLTAKNYFVDGKAQIEAVKEKTTDAKSVENLPGLHKESVWVINMVKGTKFNQVSFLEEFDKDPNDESTGTNAFWEDQWAAIEEFELEYSGDDLKKVLQADFMRRVATAANLTAADLKLVILNSVDAE